MRTLLVLIFISVLLVSCTSTKVEKTIVGERIMKADTMNYKDYWTSLVVYAPEKAIKLAPTPEHKELAEVWASFMGNKRDSMEPKLLNLYRNTKNDTIRDYAGFFLFNLYSFNNDNKSILKNLRKSGETDSIMMVQYPTACYADSAQTSVDFSSQPVTLKMNVRKGSAFVRIKINGMEKELLFDTGCQMTMLSDKLAKELNIQSTTTNLSVLSSVGNNNSSKLTMLKNVEMGKSHISNLPIGVVPASAFNFKFWFISLAKFDGIIGWDIIKNFDVTIDCQKNIIILRQPYLKPKSDPNFVWLSDPLVKMKAENGTEIIGMFDTGSDRTDGALNLLGKLHTPDELSTKTSKRIWGIGGSKKLKGYRVKFIDLYSGNTKIHFKNIKVFDKSGLSNSAFMFTDVCIGFDIIKNGRVHFDISNGIFELE
ncbi:MAG: retropepsin-like aspartic protease [bacterium]